MQATRWMGLGLVSVALFGGLLGCAAKGSYGGAPMAPSGGEGRSASAGDMAGEPAAPEAPMAPMAQSAPMMEMEAGGMPAPAPPPPPAAPRGQFQQPGAGAGAGPSADMAARKPTESRPRSEAVAPEPKDRPGLATQWGETRVSRITTVPFVRAEPMNPFSLVSLFYNDEEGARAMASAAGFRRLAPQAFTMASGAVAIGLRSESGAFLSGFVATEKTFAIGQPGQRYSIVLRNLTPNRIECVVSVDGLDVLDGQPASFSKRGYLLDPHGEVEIDGFRQSLDTVAAFRFGSVRGSYAAQKHGDTRNVGIIGVALFHERGTTPWNPAELNRRQNANPFPGQFATPPGQ